MTKEKYKSAKIKIQKNDKTAQDNAYLVLYEYYLEQNEKKFDKRNKLRDLGEFINMFNLYCSIPILHNNTPIPSCNINIALNKAFVFFNKKYNI